MAGTVGITIDAKFNDEWNDLAKHLVCRNGKVVKTKLDFQNGFTVAPETMIAGGNLEIGFEGMSQDGKIVFPTVWASCGVVKDGANANDDYSADPTNPVWDQLEKQIGDLNKLETSAKSSIVDAVNEVSNKDAKIPIATKATIGGVKAEPATKADTQPVRIGADGKLYTAPGGSGGTDNYTALKNKPKINGVELSGNKTSADLGIGDPTDEQVSNALKAYLEENPVSVENLETDIATLFATLENGILYEIDIDAGTTWDDNEGHFFVESTGQIGKQDEQGYRMIKLGYIPLRRGDLLITNADTAEWFNEFVRRKGVLLKKNADLDGGLYNDSGAIVAYGRGKYDGTYVVYQATDEIEHIRVAYKYDVDYDVRFYVAKARSNAEVVPYSYTTGYIKPTTGEVVEDTDSAFGVGYYSEVVSELITLQAPGKFLLVKNAKLGTKCRGEGPWAKYAEDGSLEYAMNRYRWADHNYMIVPLFKETERIRLNYKTKYNPRQYTEALLVDAEYLIDNGYADHMAGKTLAMFGDSYVEGHSMSAFRTWHYMFAEQHQMEYINYGHNGYGVAQSPNFTQGLIDVITEVTEADYIGVICGRNDYSCQVPIGTNDDMDSPETNRLQRTFKGSLNYMCDYLVKNFPDKKVFFLTPWYFPSRTDITETIKPVEYIDAVLEITGLWGIPCFDAARRSGIHVKSETFRTNYFLSVDDVSHLNETGAKLMMNNMNGWMLAL